MARRYKFAIIASLLLHVIVLCLLLTSEHKPDLHFDDQGAVNLVDASEVSQLIDSQKQDKVDRRESAPKKMSEIPTHQPLDLTLRSHISLHKMWSDHPNGELSAEYVDPESPGEPPKFADPSDALTSEGHGWSHSVQYANAMSLEFTNENLGFFQMLYQRVNGRLVYPEDLSRARIQGKVRIDAVLSRDGRILDINAMKADNDVLHAFVLALLIHILKDPLPANAWLTTERAVVSFDFDFRVLVVGNIPTTFTVGAMKNHLRFGRESYVEPILNEKLQEIFTHYIPPIIPIPGGFYVDLVLAYQYVKNLATNAPLESEERAKRIRALHEELKLTVHRETVAK